MKRDDDVNWLNTDLLPPQTICLFFICRRLYTEIFLIVTSVIFGFISSHLHTKQKEGLNSLLMLKTIHAGNFYLFQLTANYIFVINTVEDKSLYTGRGEYV